MYSRLCSYKNLELAFRKARKRKSLKPCVIEFENNLEENLLQLRNELIFHTYRPKPLKTFILRDPKTRRISRADFRDRVVHHALCNIIEPIFEKSFIHDSYANRKGKGTLKAVQRFEFFKRKVSKNNTRNCFVLKADIMHYFNEVDRKVLVNILKNRINDKKIIWLIKLILDNFDKKNGRGMPLGNLTSQFFANVYLNELDQFVKHELKARYYIRYVDDFIILHNNRCVLQQYKKRINRFLITLKLKMHQDKSKIMLLRNGITFLGYRVFHCHKLLKKRNLIKFKRNFEEKLKLCKSGELAAGEVIDSLQGWFGYAMWANTYNLRKRVLGRFAEACQ